MQPALLLPPTDICLRPATTPTNLWRRVGNQHVTWPSNTQEAHALPSLLVYCQSGSVQVVDNIENLLPLIFCIEKLMNHDHAIVDPLCASVRRLQCAVD